MIISFDLAIWCSRQLVHYCCRLENSTLHLPFDLLQLLQQLQYEAVDETLNTHWTEDDDNLHEAMLRPENSPEDVSLSVVS